MPEKTKKQIITYLENANLGLLIAFLIFFPIFFLSATSDAFTIPKQMLLTGFVSIAIVIYGIKTILEGKIKIRATPFDLPITVLLLCVLGSSIFAVNRIDSLTAFVPFLFTTLLFFVITNTVKQPSQLLLILGSLTLGTIISAILTIFSFFGIYPLPFAYTHVTYFNTFGSLLDQAIYFALILPITGYFVHSIFSSLKLHKKTAAVFSNDTKAANSNISPVTMGFSIAFIVIALGLALTVYQLVSSQKPLILPLETGFQTALASISQDNGRVLWGFLFGSGYGTYVTDFTKFKSLGFNLNQDLWALTFFRSSTFVLELLATTGLLGLFSFFFLVFRIIKERNFFLPLVLAVVSAFILPFSFSLLILFYVLLAIFVVIHAHNNPHKFTEIEFYFVALKHGLLATRAEGESIHQNTSERKYSKLLPLFFFVLLLLLIGLPLYLSVRYFISDIIYQRSLVAYSQNNGQQTYELQTQSINVFPYRDLYYRSFSQINIALANSIAMQARQAASPSAQAQQNILSLAQQAITSGRNAALLSPQSSYNWSNLSAIYRNLIGYGQNADKFSIATDQQAIALDPNNPLLYVDLGGIYYQLGMFDDAIRQFQLAISLKNDFANAYYNLGHAMEMKGSLQEALTYYQAVKRLVVTDSENTKKVTEEIEALQAKINTQQSQAANKQAQETVAVPSTTPAESGNETLNINKAPAQLPGVKQKINIPGPSISILPTETQSKTDKTIKEETGTSSTPNP